MVGKDDRIFILDNNRLGNGKGIIRIFRTSYVEDRLVIENDASLDYASFGSSS
jgi:hypothetical protein